MVAMWLSSIIAYFRTLFTLPPDPAPAPMPVPPSPPDVTPIPPEPGEVVEAINRARLSRRFPAIRPDQAMMSIARHRAEQLIVGGLTHGDALAQIEHVYPDTAAGEDIAEGYPTADAVVTAWLSDPPHRAILLGPYDLIGVGRATSADGTVYWAADFDLENARL